MIRHFLTFGVLILFTIQVAAQNKAVEVGMNTKFHDDKPVLLLNTSYVKNMEKNYFQKINFHVGVWRKQTIEMDEFFEQIIIAGQRVIDAEVGVGLQGNWKIRATDELFIYGGWLANLSYDHNTFIPLTSASFPERINRGEVTIGSVIGLNKRWKSNYYWNIELPIYFMEFGLERFNIDNPVIPSDERRTTTFYGMFQPKVMGKIGLGVFL